MLKLCMGSCPATFDAQRAEKSKWEEAVLLILTTAAGHEGATTLKFNKHIV